MKPFEMAWQQSFFFVGKGRRRMVCKHSAALCLNSVFVREVPCSLGQFNESKHCKKTFTLSNVFSNMLCGSEPKFHITESSFLLSTL